jgi:hypothetical protein
MPLASAFDISLTSIETNPQAVFVANRAAKEQRLDVTAIHGRVEEQIHLLEGKKKFDTIVMNPNRAGVSQKVRETICSQFSGANKVVYLSCNLYTLARDLIDFQHRGFRLKKVTSFDMMPQTDQVETLCLLERDSSMPVFAEKDQNVKNASYLAYVRGRASAKRFDVIQRVGRHSLVRFKDLLPDQIRSRCARANHPVLGDAKHDPKTAMFMEQKHGLEGLFLWLEKGQDRQFEMPKYLQIARLSLID